MLRNNIVGIIQADTGTGAPPIVGFAAAFAELKYLAPFQFLFADRHSSVFDDDLHLVFLFFDINIHVSLPVLAFRPAVFDGVVQQAVEGAVQIGATGDRDIFVGVEGWLS